MPLVSAASSIARALARVAVAASLVAAACDSGGGSRDGGKQCTVGHAPLACWTYPEGVYSVSARVPVTLQSCSYSYEGAPLTYAWAITSRPETSTAASITTGASTAVVVTDVAGDYTVALTVTDPCGSSTSSYSVKPMEWAPWASAGADGVAAIGEEVALDGTGTTDGNLDPLTYAWTVTGAPEGSTATLTGADTPTPHLTPDAPGEYEVTLEVSDGRFTDTSVVRVDAYHPALKVPVQPWDVEYSAGLDRLVVLEEGGRSLWIVNPHDAASTEVPLSAVAYSIAISGDGLHAAASHAGKLSWVDLSMGTVERELATAADGGDVVIPASGRTPQDAIVFPRLDRTIGIRVVSVDGSYEGAGQGLAAESLEASPSPARKPRVNAAGNRIHVIRGTDGFDPWSLGYAYRTTVSYGGTARDYRAKGDGPWLSPDGARVYVGSGLVYPATELAAPLAGKLALSSDTSGLRWVDDSATGGILVVPTYTGYLTNAPVRLHDRSTLALVREHPAPVVFAAGGIERGTPVYAFWKPDASGFYVVTAQWGATAMGVAEY